uniref:AsIV-cont00030-ORF1 n=1 Tax=Apophua simplicipes ichnovirus TaxID=1329648 RepID=S5DR43_9VIRU|nr:AsIV-cont00030-ORF1 [Apophua simplicipes ichnovirus]
MDYLVDVQGFKESGDIFVLKKFAMVPVDGNSIEHTEFVVEAPYPFTNLSRNYQIINSWLTRNSHGIPWDSGTIVYNEARMHTCKILQNARVVYVWGSEKKIWLTDVLGASSSVIDLKKYNCPSMLKLKFLFDYRSAANKFSKGFECPGENVKLMKLWMLMNNVFPQPNENETSELSPRTKKFLHDLTCNETPKMVFSRSKK